MGFAGTTSPSTAIYRGLPTLLKAALVVSVFHSDAALGLEYQDPRQIADDRIINRDPVIGNTGLIAWMSYNTNDVSTDNSFISVYSETDGRRGLTEELATIMYASAKPTVQSNTVTFIASYKTFRREDQTWILRQVPSRDENFPELEAFFIAKEVDGIQELVPAIDRSSMTNQVPGADTDVGGNDQDTEDAQLEPRRHPSGESEIWRWTVGDPEVQRITVDGRNDYAPSLYGDILAWQKARGFPFGWEIMALVGDTRMQLTTNFHYDMAPQVQGRDIVWYGWDGYDYEIYRYNADDNQTVQITDNRFDDVGPVIWNGVIVWESYPAVEADILMYKDGEITEISDNLEDDISPKIWEQFVVWQGFDGDDFELWLYDHSTGREAIKITSNDYDDVQPVIMDGVLVWMAYEDNWDAEVYYMDLSEIPYQPRALTQNEEDDLDPQTAGRRIVWRTDKDGRSMIMLAEPKP